MKSLFGLLFFIIIYSASFSQSWFITRGGQSGDEAWGVDTDSSGNIYWATCEIPFLSWYFNINLYKINPNGQQIWQTIPWGGTYNDKAFVTKVKAPYVYIGGRSDSTGAVSSADALVLCYNMNDAVFQWQYKWGQGYGYEEIDGLEIENDGIYVSGWTTGQASSNDFMINKISLNGQHSWNKSWGTNLWDDANGHMVVDSNYIYIVGRINATGQLALNGDMALSCFSRTDGSYQWHVSWGGASMDDAFGMTSSIDNYLYLVGFTTSYGNGSQIFTNKYRKNGQLIWSKLWGGSGAESSRAIVTNGDSIIYVAGKTTSYGAGDNDIFLLKYNSSGTLLDSAIWGGQYNDVAHDIVKQGNSIYITGETGSFGNGNTNGDHKSDALLLKIIANPLEFPDIEPTSLLSASSKEINKFFFFDQNTKQLFMINSQNSISISNFKMFNISGIEINIPGINKNSNFKIDLSKFPSGIYFISYFVKFIPQTEKIIIYK